VTEQGLEGKPEVFFKKDGVLFVEQFVGKGLKPSEGGISKVRAGGITKLRLHALYA
jgi:hypothetical protein